MQIARSRWSWARERKKKSIGSRRPRGALGSSSCQGSVQKGHVAVRRDDVGTVGFDLHAVLDLVDLHAGVAFDQVAENALVVRGEVLHQDKGHAGLVVGGKAEKKASNAASPPADAPMPTMGNLPSGCASGRTSGAVRSTGSASTGAPVALAAPIGAG